MENCLNMVMATQILKEVMRWHSFCLNPFDFLIVTILFIYLLGWGHEGVSACAYFYVHEGEKVWFSAFSFVSMLLDIELCLFRLEYNERAYHNVHSNVSDVPDVLYLNSVNLRALKWYGN